jgi:hypothetical protein
VYEITAKRKQARTSISLKSGEGIDLSFSCSFNLSQRQAWQAAISDNDVKEQDHDNLSKTDGNNIRNKFLLFVFF